MHFAEQDHGDYRVYGGALDGRDGTYRAAVVVVRLRGHRNQPEIVYRDERVAAGYAFSSAEQALKRAMEEGQSILRSRFEPAERTKAGAEPASQGWPLRGLALVS
jgi:hypothetical protein